MRRATANANGLLQLFRSSEMALGLSLAVAVGSAAALGAHGFIWLARFFHQTIFELGGLAAALPGGYYAILAPAVGGLIVGPLIYRYARDYRGHGVPEVMLAVAARGGRLPPQVIAAKTMASAICLGSGGSVGRVGPIIQIGAGIASAAGQALRLPDERLRLMVACGAAAGVAATFNAPIAGVFFALEVILGEFAARSFSLVVLSSVTAAIITRAIAGNAPAFAVPTYALASAWEIPLYFVLGLLCAGAAAFFIRAFYALWDLFDAWRAPEYLKPAGGGLAVGALGYAFPDIMDGGFEGIATALRGELSLDLMLALGLLKIVATELSLGSGGSGGVFAPTLFIGAMFGGAYGRFVNSFWPDLTADSGAYSLVGMSALFGAAANAPITAILIVFEMTDDYHIVLPLMACTGVSYVLSTRLEPESIYTMKLRRKGYDIRSHSRADLMHAVRVAEAMTTDFETVPANLPLPELNRRLASSHQRGFPVLDERGELYGVVTLTDVERAAARQVRAGTAGDIATTQTITVFPGETLHDALCKLAGGNAGYLPVVDPLRPGQVIGLLRREDILGAYGRALGRQTEMALRLQRLSVETPTGTCFVEFAVPPSSPLVGHAVRDLPLPHDCIIVSLRRGGQIAVPRGDTVIRQDDSLVVFCTLTVAPAVEDLFAGNATSAQGKGGPLLTAD